MRKDLIIHPTLRDLVVQHAGINRDMCPDPDVIETKTWASWLDFAAAASDKRLIELRTIECRFTALMAITGHIAQWQEERYGVFEMADLYHTPGKAETELSGLLRTRRTDGPLRDLMAADAAKAAGRMREMLSEERLAPMAEFAAKGTYDDGPIPTISTFDALSDWGLNREWLSLRMRTAFYEMYAKKLDWKPDPSEEADAPSSPTP
jgi:hypothetical protein